MILLLSKVGKIPGAMALTVTPRCDHSTARERVSDAMAALLEKKLRTIGQTEFVFPREASALFVRLPDDVVEGARAAGWNFQSFFLPGVYRLMCSWNTTETAIDSFITDLRA